MSTFAAVCLALITVELGIIAVVLVATLLRVRRTAEAVEILAWRLDEEVGEVGTTLRSGWIKAVGTAGSFLAGLWSGRRRG